MDAEMLMEESENEEMNLCGIKVFPIKLLFKNR